KTVRFVKTAEEMTHELMDRGLSGTKLTVLPAPEVATSQLTFEGDRLARLVRVLGDLEEALVILERRGLSLPTFLARAGQAGLPVYRVLLGGREHWFASPEEVDAFRRAEQEKHGGDLTVADETPGQNGNGHTETFFVQELHEVRGVNRGLEQLREFGL